MRLSRKELKTKYPTWNEEKHNIVSVMYGDEPLLFWNNEVYEKYSKNNLDTVGCYIYYKNGEYLEYRTLIGDVKINTNGDVLCGNINVKYRGKTININLNKMYGMNSLDILRISQKVKGFSNSDGIGSPTISKNTEEMTTEEIEQILNSDLSDYGESIQLFMIACRELYNRDNTNHIMEKTFKL